MASSSRSKRPLAIPDAARIEDDLALREAGWTALDVEYFDLMKRAVDVIELAFAEAGVDTSASLAMKYGTAALSKTNFDKALFVCSDINPMSSY